MLNQHKTLHRLTGKFGPSLKTWVILICFIPFAVSCKKMIQVPAPASSINSENVFSASSTAIAAVNALYRESDIANLFVTGGLSADELTLYDLGNYLQPYYSNSLQPDPGPSSWNSCYTKIFYANALIEGLNAGETLTPAVKQQLLGEAKFMRAFFYFYLVNLYGDVPLALTTNPEVNRLLARSASDQVYSQITDDLIEAQKLLSKDFLSGNLMSNTNERVRPSYWSATALLARVYLYKGNYSEAVTQSSLVINNASVFQLSSLNDVFLKNSNETIWAFQALPGGVPYNAIEGTFFILPSGPETGGGFKNVYLSNALVNSFEPGDARYANWVNTVTVSGVKYPYAYKYKADISQTSVTEYQIVLRLGEQYLIRAEAHARLGHIAEAVADLNAIRNRARGAATVDVPNPLPALSDNLSSTQLMGAVEQERKVELFTEFGHRWLDLKRMPGLNNLSQTRADEVMPDVCAAKGGIWKPEWKLLPIPREQLEKDPNMTHAQNPGYQ